MFIGIAIILGALFGLMTLFGLMQPRVVKLDRTILIDGDRVRIFSEIANPIVRCGQPVMRRMIGNDFAKGLSNLKTKTEA